MPLVSLSLLPLSSTMQHASCFSRLFSVTGHWVGMSVLSEMAMTAWWDPEEERAEDKYEPSRAPSFNTKVTRRICHHLKSKLEQRGSNVSIFSELILHFKSLLPAHTQPSLAESLNHRITLDNSHIWGVKNRLTHLICVVWNVSILVVWGKQLPHKLLHGGS